MENKKRELRKIKRALYVCTAFLITNLGLSSCGVETKEEVKQEEISLEDGLTETKEILNENLDELKEDCILFHEVPEDIVYDEIGDSYMMGDFEVIRAEKNGVSYLLDASDYHVLVSNYVSVGRPVVQDEENAYIFLAIDGYDYVVDATDFKTIIDIIPTSYTKQSNIYLDGSGEVIESYVCEKRYLLDTKTRDPIWMNNNSKVLEKELQ